MDHLYTTNIYVTDTPQLTRVTDFGGVTHVTQSDIFHTESIL